MHAREGMFGNVRLGAVGPAVEPEVLDALAARGGEGREEGVLAEREWVVVGHSNPVRDDGELALGHLARARPACLGLLHAGGADEIG